MPERFTTSERDIAELSFDTQNPRIPIEAQQLSQEELLAYVAENYNSLAVAKSIARHSYFPSEPLIVFLEGDNQIVVEGNRRLAALKLLAYPELRNYLSDRSEWDAIEINGTAPTQVPVILVDNRRDVAPIIGYRHISGIQAWDAYAKARYIASQKEAGMTFEQVASEVGEKEMDVRASYRNFKIAGQLSALGFDAADVFEDFGVFTRAMQSKGIREFIKAPAAREVTDGDPIAPENHEKLIELIGFIFGDDAVIQDSRDLTQLGKVLESEDGLRVLRETRDLEQADIASGGLLERLITRLNSAATNLRGARPDIRDYATDARVLELLEECEEELNHLRDQIN